MWENINKLRKKRGRESKEVKLYNENMEELDQDNVKTEMEGFWTVVPEHCAYSQCKLKSLPPPCRLQAARNLYMVVCRGQGGWIYSPSCSSRSRSRLQGCRIST